MHISNIIHSQNILFRGLLDFLKQLFCEITRLKNVVNNVCNKLCVTYNGNFLVLTHTETFCLHITHLFAIFMMI